MNLSHADPLRVQKMLEQRLIFRAADWDAAERSTEAAQLRRELDLKAHELGREITGRLHEARDRIERKHMRAAAEEQASAEAELLKERDHRLRLLRVNTEAATRELETSVRR